VGCEYDIPERPHWSERVWYDLHVVREDGWRHYLNGGDLAIRRDAFEAIGGFAEHLAVGEDTEICARLRAAGHRIWESQRLRVVHLGNPKSVGAFFRKQAWHGISVLDDPSLRGMNKATLMIYTFTGLCAAALVLLVAPSPLGAGARALLATGAVLAVPVAAVAYRAVETRRIVNPVLATLLYVVYFAARAKSLLAALLRPRRRAPAPAA
jgi:cellulose synthase/poly-beta-1,6-N-acetylglucosamine synthase-like glycosyltransferase